MNAYGNPDGKGLGGQADFGSPGKIVSDKEEFAKGC